MNKVLIITFIVLMISGCNDATYEVKCDSGFITGIVEYAYIDDGVILWEDFNGTWKSRKMLNGETCQVLRVANP